MKNEKKENVDKVLDWCNNAAKTMVAIVLALIVAGVTAWLVYAIIDHLRFDLRRSIIPLGWLEGYVVPLIIGIVAGVITGYRLLPKAVKNSFKNW